MGNIQRDETLAGLSSHLELCRGKGVSSFTQTKDWDVGPSHLTGSVLCLERYAFLRTAFITPGQRLLSSIYRMQSSLLASHQSQRFLSECTRVNRTAIIERPSAEPGGTSSDVI